MESVESLPVSLPKCKKTLLQGNALNLFSILCFLCAFCAIETPAFAQAAYVQQCSQYTAGNGSGATASCTLTGVTAGDALVIGVWSADSTLHSVSSSTTSQPVNEIADYYASSNNDGYMSAYILPNTPSGSITITANETGYYSPVFVSVVEYTGVAASPFDASGTGYIRNWGPASLPSSTYTTTSANDMLWSMCSGLSGTTFTAGTVPITWTARGTNTTSPSLFWDDGVAGAAGSYYGDCYKSSDAYDTDIISLALKPSSQASTPTFSPSAGTYAASQTVTISDSTSGSAIYYTTDGTTPTTASTTYSTAVTVSVNETLKAIATASGYTTSSVGSAAYVINGPAATPTFNPAAGAYGPAQSVTISDGTAGATIYYTTNGTTPSSSSSIYSSAITVSATETLEAIALAPVYETSAVGSATYTINGPAATPTFSPASGTYSSAQTVSISDSTAGSTIYYTTDGTTPTTTSSVYSSAITVSTAETLEAIATASSYTSSLVGSAAYTIAAATPAFSPAAGTYSSAQSVTISDSTSGSTIYYTTNGTTPTTASSVYSSAIAVSATETLEAIATASGYAQSATTSDVYTFPQVASPAYVQQCSQYTAGNGSGATASCTLTGVTAGDALVIGVWSADSTLSSVTSSTTAQPVNQISDYYVASNSNGYMSAYILPNAPAGSITITANETGRYNADFVVVSEYTNAAASPFDGSGTGYMHNYGANTYLSSSTYTTTSTSDMLWSMCSDLSGVSFGPGNAPSNWTSRGTNTTSPSLFWEDVVAGAAGTYSGQCEKTSVGYDTDIISLALIGGASGQAATPTFSPATGTYTSIQSVTISDATPGASVFYTTNGTTPTTASTVYSGPITVLASETLQAIATASTYSQSATGSAAYTINLPAAATPTFSPSAGTYTTIQTVTISDATGGATIYYTTNGTTPTISSAVYSGPITVTATKTLEAIAIAYGYSQSATGSAPYTINLSPASTPTFSPGAGTYTSIQTVTISDSTSGSTIYYTTNGTTPTTNSAIYSGAITVNTTKTLEAIATAYGYSQSATGSAAYTINLPPAATPTFSPASGTYSTIQTVSISDSTSGSTIYYTTNGTTPTTASSVYSSAISVSASGTVEAIAIATANGYSQSATGSAAYTILITATPTFSPAGGAYPTAQTVTISDATSGATIYYTTDGTTPTTASAVYSSPITQSASGTLEAIATASSYSQSLTGSATYTIGILPNGTYLIQNLGSGFDLDGGGPGTSPSTWVVQDAYIGVNQMWKTTSLGGTTYQIVSAGSSLSLDDLADDTTNGSEIDVYTASGGTGNKGQVWYLTSTSGGYYTIASQDMVNAGNTTCIEPSGGATTTGAEIVIYTCTNTSAEQWEFIPVTAAPTFSPATGVYPTTQTVTISDSTSGATIYYTTDGTTPTTSSTVYSGPITVSASMMFNTIAVATGYLPSQVASAAYGIGSLPVNGLYYIQNLGSGLVLDGGGPGTIKQTQVVQDANTSGTNQQWILSSLGSSTFSIVSNADGLALDDLADGVSNGTIIDVYTNTASSGNTGQIWTLTPASAGYYTLESQDIINAGADSCIEPSGGSTASGTGIVIYTCTDTSAEQWQFVLIEPSAATPTLSLAPGTYTSAQTITISDSSSGATIYYTTNGTTPTSSSAVYSSPLTISCCTTETVEAIAGGTGYWPSTVASATYTITLPTAATPSFSPAAGTYSSAQTVTISDGTSGTTIYYTTNGTTPTTSSAQYTGAITVSSPEMVEAIAVASGYNQSSVGAADYTIGTVTLSACSGMSVGSSVAGTADMNGFVPFQSATGMTTLWNTNIVNAPIDPNNAAIQTTSGYSGQHTHINFGSSPSNGGIPFMIVDSSSTPTVPINVVDYASESDVVVAPYPSNVPIEGNYADCSGWPDTYQGDAHTNVLDRNTCWDYETYNTNRCNGLYDASGETIWDMTNGEMRPWGWTSTDAAGLSVMAGLLKYDEAASGHINHAIRFTMQQSKNDANHGYFVEPASHAAGTTYGAPTVEGMRVRLKPTFDISGYSSINQAILTALQQYGMIMADNGGYFYIQGATDSRWNNSDLANIAGIPSSDFDVIQMTPSYPGYDSATAPTGTAPAISSFTANGNTGTITISSGSSVTFDFSASGDSYDYIDMIGPVRLTSGSGSVTITPTATQTYMLYSVNQYGNNGDGAGYGVTVSSPITVVVTGSTVVPPTFTPVAGTYTGPQVVTFNTTTYPYATFYYTTDGSTPTTNSTMYPQIPQPMSPQSVGNVEDITVSASETIKAIAVVSGYSSPSTVSSAAYTIN